MMLGRPTGENSVELKLPYWAVTCRLAELSTEDETLEGTTDCIEATPMAAEPLARVKFEFMMPAVALARVPDSVTVVPGATPPGVDEDFELLRP